MADATLQTYHQAIKDALTARLSANCKIYDHDPEPDAIETPAAIISLDTFSENDDFQPGNVLTLDCEWSVYVVLGRNNGSEMQCRLFAQEIVRILRKEKYLSFDNVKRPEGFFALATAWKDDLKTFSSWVVSWEVTIDIPDIVDAGDIEDLLRVYGENSQAADAPLQQERVDF